jgi:hypothetical protein
MMQNSEVAMKEEEREQVSAEAVSTEEERSARKESVLEEMLEQSAPVPSFLAPSGQMEILVGEVVDVKHPTLRGRVRVRWQDLEGQTFEKWLPTLQGLPVRVADRVMMTRAVNWPEHVVTGVVDGFANRPEIERETAAAVELQRDEALRVRSASGEDLVEVFEDERGPVIRLLKEDVDLDLQGKLRVRAKSIELEAKQGQAKIKASDDVIVNGEVIHLN